MSETDFLPLGESQALADSLSGTAAIDPTLTRTNYFDGRLLRARDLTRDQMYLDFRLREYGKGVGSGVVEGLALSIDITAGERFTISPGVGVTNAGRTLETPEIQVELSRESLNELNPGAGFHLNRGLYALVLSYAEVPIRIAEVFPRDLTLATASHPDVLADAIQVGLAPLTLQLPQDGNELRNRAQVAAALFTGQAIEQSPQDSLTLGIVAIAEDRVLWVDPLLMTRRLRENGLVEQRQRELARHYNQLFAEVAGQRAAAGGQFRASEFFRLLPPGGVLPKVAIDPQQATQQYFPENVSVEVSPVLASDVDLILDEAMSLPPIDLLATDPVDVLVLVPLSASEFTRHARQLEQQQSPRHLAAVAPLQTRLRRFRTTHNQALWNTIFDAHTSTELVYVRRPMRAAETHISAIQLAQGVNLPPAAGAAGPVPDVDTQVLDEIATLRSTLGIPRLNILRPATTVPAQRQQARLDRLSSANPQLLRQILEAATLLDRRYNPVFWETLFRLVAVSNLSAFIQLLIDNPNTLPSALITANPELRISAGLTNRWNGIDQP